MGERVFIKPESSGRSVLRAYVRYLSIVVQRLSCTSRYQPEGIPKRSERSILMAYIWYYSTEIQRLFRMICYYTVDSVNSATYVRLKWRTSVILFIEYDCTIC
jgi:hypothetical protein